MSAFGKKRSHDGGNNRGDIPKKMKTEATSALNFPLKQSSTQAELPPYNGHRSTLPPLPPIKDPALALVPFTLPQFYHLSTAEKLHTTYDRLEFLGDAYIEVIASRLVFNLFPNLTAGRLSQQRELRVKNETLAEYAMAYGFDKQARGLNPEVHKGAGKIWTKAMGDIFEAYVAAIIMSDPQQGFQNAEAWLVSLWASKLTTGTAKPSSGTQMANLNAKPELAKRVLGRGIKLEYRDEKAKEIRREGKTLFSVGVYLTGWGWEGQHLGSGTALSKQEAGHLAAVDAMQNPLTERVNAVKREFDAKVAAEKI